MDSGDITAIFLILGIFVVCWLWLRSLRSIPVDESKNRPSIFGIFTDRSWRT